ALAFRADARATGAALITAGAAVRIVGGQVDAFSSAVRVQAVAGTVAVLARLSAGTDDAAVAAVVVVRLCVDASVATARGLPDDVVAAARAACDVTRERVAALTRVVADPHPCWQPPPG